MNMNYTRWLYVARHQWRFQQLAALRETTPQEENIDEKKWGAWGKGANEKWGEEESLKKTGKNVPLKQSNEDDG